MKSLGTKKKKTSSHLFLMCGSYGRLLKDTFACKQTETAECLNTRLSNFYFFLSSVWNFQPCLQVYHNFLLFFSPPPETCDKNRMDLQPLIHISHFSVTAFFCLSTEWTTETRSMSFQSTDHAFFNTIKKSFSYRFQRWWYFVGTLLANLNIVIISFTVVNYWDTCSYQWTCYFLKHANKNYNVADQNLLFIYN